MKVTRFLLAFLIVVPFLQSCQDDITDLADPRDAIVKKWRVTDSDQISYDVTISKDPSEKTRVLLSNFHNLGTADKLYATIAGTNLTIPSQLLDNEYTIEGDGTIISNGENINFEFSVAAGQDPKEDFTARFGDVITVKKKAKNIPLQ